VRIIVTVLTVVTSFIMAFVLNLYFLTLVRAFVVVTVTFGITGID
jgi:hypothetical protein